MNEQDPEPPQTRISWVPHVKNPAAPTAEELAAGVPLDGWAVVDDGLQFARDDSAEILPLPARTVGFYLDPLEPDWIVLRAADDLPPGAMPPALDGLWINKPPAYVAPVPEDGIPIAVFVPTGRFETRDDGAVAEVYEMRP